MERAVALFAPGLLLARPRGVHLEHQDPGGSRTRSATCSRARLADVKPSGLGARRERVPHRGRRRHRGWITFEDRDVARGYRPHPHQGRTDSGTLTHRTTGGSEWGHEEKGRLHPPARGESPGVKPRRPHLDGEREAEARAGLRDAALRFVSSAAARAANPRSAARLAAGVAHHHVEKTTSGPATAGAKR